MKSKFLAALRPGRADDVGLMLALALGGVFGPVIAFDVLALLAGWAAP